MPIHERSDTAPTEGEHKYGNVEYLDETNKKYPVDTAEHVRAAASYLGMPKNAEKYSRSELVTMRNHLHRREQELGIGKK